MKPFSLLILLFISTQIMAQNNIDSLLEILEEQKGKIEATDERLNLIEGDVDKLKKIKVSGYVQAQFTDNQLSTASPMNSFSIRRARLKFQYKNAQGLKLVVQPDFNGASVSLKDAYAVVNDPWLKTFSLWMGQFNRPNYEVEYSSSQREVPERSRVIRTLYPGEREVGAKLEVKPVKIPLKLQIALLNGNFTGKENADVDNMKDWMTRATYSLNFPNQGIGIDFGAHAYLGKIRAKDSKLLTNSDLTVDTIASGDYLDKKWFGAEMQIFWDFLGGMSLKGEYLAGQTASLGVKGTTTTTNNNIRDISGFYGYFIKNLGVNDQLVLRYDNFDPNTKLTGDMAGSELYYNTLAVAWQHYYDENLRITVGYEMPKNEKNVKNKNEDIRDNLFTLRIQAKF